MEIGWFFISVIITTAWCLGWYTITGEGQALGFIRRWFTKTQVVELNIDALKKLHPSEQQMYRQVIYEDNNTERTVLYQKTLVSYPWYGKPIVTCIKCLSSIHGTIIFWFLTYEYSLMYDNSIFAFWVMNCVISSFLNDYFYTKKKSL